MLNDEFGEYFTLREQGKYREAYAQLRRIMNENAHLAEIGDMHMRCAEFEVIINDDVSQARKLLESARELGRHDKAYFHCLNGYVLWRTGDRDAGIRDLETSVELDPSMSNLHSLGNVLASEGDARAIDVWQRVLEREPNDCLAHVYLGAHAAKSGDQEKGVALAKKAEGLDPSPGELREIGGLYTLLEDFHSAIRVFLEADALGYEPKGEICAAIASCHFSLGRIETGREYLRRALKHDPDH